jgi:signal transduction histidine kinase
VWPGGQQPARRRNPHTAHPRYAAADALAVEQQQTIRSAIADVRWLVHELRPPALAEIGLVSAVRELAARYQGEHTDSPLRVVVDIPELLPPLSAAVEVAAAHIVQEALTNVARHAEASRCHVRLVARAGMLEVEIVDDGIGLLDSRHAGVGIHSMRERAEELGGTCVVERAPGGGTSVLARLPLGS